jgi:hypothetical protein
MALTNTLKTQVDLPVWEWCRFAPATTTAISSLTTGNNLSNRYLYYQVSGEIYRYDTVSDSWNRLTNMSGFTNPTIMNANVLSNSVGHPGQAIGSGGGNNTMQIAGLSGSALVGYKIRITDGTGRGQERTITAVSAPTIHERGTVTTAGTQSIVDANTGPGLKQWKVNQWKNYQFRATYGTGRTQLRPILYNSGNSLVWSDANYTTVNPWANALMNISIATTTQFVIESHIITVDTNWTTNPDSTSTFMIMSGGIWNITQGTTSAPFFSLSYYDILADQWYGKTTTSGLRTAVYTAASDLSMERLTENGGAIVAATAVASATIRTVTTAAVMTPNQYKNFELRIVSGTGIGQSKEIASNSANVFYFSNDWEITPDATSTYQVWRDVGKIFLVGGGYSDLLQYSTDRDQWTPSRIFDDGQANNLAAKLPGQKPFALTSITRTATGMKLKGTITTAGANYQINDVLTVTGIGSTLLVTGVDAVGGVTSVDLMTVGTGATVGAKATTANPAGGVGCTITLAAGDIDFTELAVTPIAHNFKVGDSVTISGATGAGAAKFNGTYTIIGTPNTTSFSYCSVGDPGAATATIPFTQSTTTLVDCTKNWAVNEHVGKIVQTTTNALLSTGQCRVITANTATTLTFVTGTAPVNGTSRYIIHDCKPYGTGISNNGRVGGGSSGYATGGSTTTLIDTTKNWEPNSWARVVGRKVMITEGTGAGAQITIISNTATTLTFAAQAFTVDTTTRYVIMDAFGMVSGAGGISTLSATPTVAGTGYAVGDIFAITGGTARGQVMVAAGGIPSVIRLIDGGVSGYTVVAGVATTNVTGTGTGLTVNVTAITAIGSTTVMQDNTKNWDTNAWVGKRLRFLSGASQGNEYTIVSNTFNTITTAAGTAPDAATAYAILDASPKTFGMHIDNVTGCSDTTLNHKYLYSFVGSATVEMERYDITTEQWEKMSYFPQFETQTTGTMYVYDGADRIYINTGSSGTIGRLVYYHLPTNTIVNAGTIPYGHSTAISGNRMEIIETEDGLKYLYIMRHSGTEMWRTLLYY